MSLWLSKNSFNLAIGSKNMLKIVQLHLIYSPGLSKMDGTSIRLVSMREHQNIETLKELVYHMSITV